jgi:hypothetical protein
MVYKDLPNWNLDAMKLEILCYVTGCVLVPSWNVDRENEINKQPLHPRLSGSITLLSDTWILPALFKKCALLYVMKGVSDSRVQVILCHFILLMNSEIFSEIRYVVREWGSWHGCGRVENEKIINSDLDYSIVKQQIKLPFRHPSTEHLLA